MPTLHSNNPVPSNGSVAMVICGVKSISMTLSGVGAIRAVVQIMSHEDGAAPGPIGSQIVVSGTTTVTTTQTFNAEAGKVYLQLIDITPACKFSATLTELGPIQDTNPGSPTSPFASTTTVAELNALAASGGPFEIYVTNPAVFSTRKTRMIKNVAGTGYFVPIGEDIASRYANPIKTVSPGVLTAVEMYGAIGDESPVIPDCILQDGMAWQAECSIACSVLTAGSPIFGVGLASSMPESPISADSFQIGRSTQINVGAGYRGPNLGTTSYGYRIGGNLPRQAPDNYHTFYPPAAPAYVAGACRVFAMIQAANTGDTFKLWSYRFVSRGMMG